MNRKTTIRGGFRAAALVALGALIATGAMADVRESRTIHDSFDLASRGRVAIDNIFGSIEITGTSGNRVEMTVIETIEAEDDQALERARQEVELLIDNSDALLDLFVDGPFRDRDDRNRWSSRQWESRYQVHYDFVLEVPAGVTIELKTVNEGEIAVTGVRGDFEVSNVNGGVEMGGLAGSGTVRTVNGPIKLDFAASPTSASEFVTVNGNVDVSFPHDLSADLRLETSWGELWSDFQVTPLSMQPVVRKTKAGKTVIKQEGMVVRVAAGGPQLSFETLNGDVLIRRRDRGER